MYALLFLPKVTLIFTKSYIFGSSVHRALLTVKTPNFCSMTFFLWLQVCHTEICVVLLQRAFPEQPVLRNTTLMLGFLHLFLSLYSSPCSHLLLLEFQQLFLRHSSDQNLNIVTQNTYKHKSNWLFFLYYKEFGMFKMRIRTHQCRNPGNVKGFLNVFMFTDNKYHFL